ESSRMGRHLHDIAGASSVTAPAPSHLQHDEVGPQIQKYMRPLDGVDGEHRTRLFHAIRDYTADAFGGWQLVTMLQSGGGLYAQRLVTRKHDDMDKAKARALAIAGITKD